MIPADTHGSPELDEDAAKLAAMDADPGPTFADVFSKSMTLPDWLRARSVWIADPRHHADIVETMEDAADEIEALLDKARAGEQAEAELAEAKDGWDNAIRTCDTLRGQIDRFIADMRKANARAEAAEARIATLTEQRDRMVREAFAEGFQAHVDEATAYWRDDTHQPRDAAKCWETSRARHALSTMGGAGQ